MKKDQRSEIEEKYATLGGTKSSLKQPRTPEQDTPDGVGRYREYLSGSIYWTPETGAHEIHGAIRLRWDALKDRERLLGYPVTDEIASPDGRGKHNDFQRGSIYHTDGTGPHEIYGPIWERWKELGRETSRLGYPKSKEQEHRLSGGRVQEFEGGRIFWDSRRGAYEVYSVIAPTGCDELAHGRWDRLEDDTHVVGIHAALLNDGNEGKVLFFSHGNPVEETDNEQQMDVGSAVLDILTRQVTQQNIDPGVICSGHTFLRDGSLIACGSERELKGVNAVRRFTLGDDGGGRWEHLHDLNEARWYPTCVELPGGRVIILGGHKWSPERNVPNSTYEIYDPASGLLPGGPVPVLRNGYAMYPFTFVLPSGELIIHAGVRTAFLNLSTMTFDRPELEAAARPRRNARTYDVQGTAILLPLLPDSDPPYRARVMLIGGGGAPEVTARTPATETCEILDLGAASPAWQLAAPMNNPRVMPDAVLLPDGTVFVANGSSTGSADCGANPVLEAEVYDPQTGAWATLCPMSIPRLYHSVALLLPDGSVLTAGPDSVWYPAPYNKAKLRIEIFSPPYMSRGQRPLIQNAPDGIGYGEKFEVESQKAGAIKAAALISPGSVTHSFNFHQRYVGLPIVSRQSSRLSLLTPPNEYVAPPGYYMLFIVDEDGIPSIAHFIRLS
jgi:Domain of unknown function (DUF1929)/Glyoxal oxidase N-terminus/LGFP repeat